MSVIFPLLCILLNITFIKLQNQMAAEDEQPIAINKSKKLSNKAASHEKVLTLRKQPMAVQQSTCHPNYSLYYNYHLEL